MSVTGGKVGCTLVVGLRVRFGPEIWKTGLILALGGAGACTPQVHSSE